MKKCLISVVLGLIFGFQYVNSVSLAQSSGEATFKCVKQLDILTSESVAACYHKNMPGSTLTNDTIKDQLGRTWKFIIKGKCTPDDDCKINVTQGKIKYDILLWYEMDRERKL